MPRSYDKIFTGQTVQRVEAFFAAQLTELELLTMFEILATTEAILRLDFEERVKNRWRDGVSRKFREIAKKGSNIRLDDDILETWKAEQGVNVSFFRAALHLRDWLAHGRHWHPKLGQGYTPAHVYQISKALFAALTV